MNNRIEMTYLFMDESDDLGFDFSKKKTSKHFLIGCLIVKNQKEKKSVEKIVKRIFARFSKQEVKTHASGLHAFKGQPKTIIKLLSQLSKKEILIGVIKINKKVANDQKINKHKLYSHMTSYLINQLIHSNIIRSDQGIELIASRRETNKHLNRDFISDVGNEINSNHDLNLKVNIKPAKDEKCLQVIDSVCWSFYKAYEHKDVNFRRIIHSKVIIEISYKLK